MAYKLIAVDMDGTLLDSNNQISPRTVDAIKLAMDKGVVFTLSTGRPLQGVQKYIDQLGLNCPVITYNGAVVAHSITGEIIFNQIMDAAEAKLVYNQAKKRGTMFVVWSKNQLYVSEFGEKADFYQDVTATKAQLLTDFDAVLAQGITKILWFDDVETTDLWAAEMKAENMQHTTVTKSRAYFLEFFSNKTSKAVAMEKLGEYYGIDKSEMIAVGDQTNDLPMIEYAGLGVAMGNAVDSVKAAADYITDTNNNDGVAKVIENFVINR